MIDPADTEPMNAVVAAVATAAVVVAAVAHLLSALEASFQCVNRRLMIDFIVRTIHTSFSISSPVSNKKRFVCRCTAIFSFYGLIDTLTIFYTHQLIIFFCPTSRMQL